MEISIQYCAKEIQHCILLPNVIATTEIDVAVAQKYWNELQAPDIFTIFL